MQRPTLFAWRLGKGIGEALDTLNSSRKNLQLVLANSPANADIVAKTAVGQELQLVNYVEAVQQYAATQEIQLEQIPRNPKAYTLLMKRGPLSPEEIQEQLDFRSRQEEVLARSEKTARSELERIAPGAIPFFDLAFAAFSWTCCDAPYVKISELGKNLPEIAELGQTFFGVLKSHNDADSVFLALNQWDKAVEEFLIQ